MPHNYEKAHLFIIWTFTSATACVWHVMILVCVSPHTLVSDCVQWCNSDQVPSGPTGVFVQLNHSLSSTHIMSFVICHHVSAPNVTFTGTFQVKYEIQQAEWPWTLSTAQPWKTFSCMEIISYYDANFVQTLPSIGNSTESRRVTEGHTHTHTQHTHAY